MNHKKLLKSTRNKKTKHNKIAIIARCKLNSVEALISQALRNSEINHGDATTVINEEENYKRLKENIRMIKYQRSCPEKKN